jgi:fibronectin type 3 domain-containing protein
MIRPFRVAALGRLAMAAGALSLVAASLVVTGQAAAASDTTAPSEPGTITTSSLTASSVALKWGGSTDSSGIEGYRVYRGFSGGALSLIATTDAVTSSSATHLYSGRSYTFGVTAIDASNNESAMRTVAVTTSGSSDTTVPSAPSSTSVSFRVFSSSRIDVVWAGSSSSDIAGYRVYRNGTQIGSVDLPNGLRFSDNGLTAATSYAYVVKAVDSAGHVSAGTTSKSATTLAAGAVIIARGPYLSNVTGSSAVISWWTNLAATGSVAIHGQAVAGASAQHHQVAVKGLSPGTSYPYTVSSGTVSASGTVRTAASAGQTYSFAAIGDFGGNSTGESQNAANIAGAGTQFIQTLGDNIYPTSGLPDPNFSTTYSDFDQRFFKPFSVAIKSQGFFPANGNKEYYGNGEFWAAFPMPGSNHSWYSYDWGDAHILVLDSEQPLATGTAQYNFAQTDLTAHQGAKWRIVALQRPPYSSVSANSSSKPVQQYLVPLFQTKKVQLVLSGNSHNYERTYPLTNGARATSGGITYVVSGAGGNGFNVFQLSPPAYSAFREASYYEYAKVTVSPTQLKVDAIRADTNAIFDTTTISAS